MAAGLLAALSPAYAAEPPPLLARAGDAQAASLPLYLEVSLNQGPYQAPQPFELRAGRLHASVATLRALGFVLAGHEPAEVLAVDAVPGVAVRYDAALQRVAIDAPLAQLSLATTRLNQPGLDLPEASASPGLLLNYDLYASRERRSDNVTAYAELRAFGLGSGVFSQTAATRHYRQDGAARRTDSVRLDSSWRWSAPESMLSLSIGDVVSGRLDWTRPLRLGGLRLGRDFGLQPYRITTPLPTFAGEVALPSAVDLYVNGLRQYSGELPPGPFQLATVPGISGAGSAQIVITDAFGRTRQLDFPFYAAQQLLARGLSDWSLSLGLAREDYALKSFSYGDSALASAELRYGLRDRLTVEAHGEGGDGIANAGLGAVALLGRAGVLSGSLAHGRDARNPRPWERSGWQYAAAYNWGNGRFNLSLDSRRAERGYRDLASRYGLGPARISERALLSWNDARLGSFGLNYVRLAYRDQDGGRQAPARYAGLHWSRSFGGRAHLGLSYNQNLDLAADRSAYLGLSLDLGERTRLAASLQRDRGRDQAVLDLSQPVPGDGGFGWRLQARGGDGAEGGLAELGWLNSVGRFGLGLARVADQDYAYASGSGALVWMGGHAFAARSVSDAFAVVSTDGVAGVPVLLENRPIGRTDADGMLLVTPLNAWQRNRLGIDAMALPAQMRVDRVEAQATPRDRSGTLVRFGLTPIRAAVVVLHDAAGRPLAPGSRVRSDHGEDAWVGYDGETYLEALQDRNRLRATAPDGRVCEARFEHARSERAGDGIARIGPVTCAAEAPR